MMPKEADESPGRGGGALASRERIPRRAGSAPKESVSRVDGKRSAPASIEQLQQEIDYRFHNIELLFLALTHRSLAYEEQRKPSVHGDNERLEFLGDAILGQVMAEYLFRTCPELDEGSLTRLRAQLVNRQHLGRAARKLSLGDYLRLGKSEERNGGRKKVALLANAVEALIAAVYLDGGPEPASRLVRQWLVDDDSLERMVAAARAGESVGDHKSALQEYFQAHGMGQPRYEVTAESGPDHHKCFVVALEMESPDGTVKVLASASGTRKKDAEQEAARIAFERLHGAQLEAGESA